MWGIRKRDGESRRLQTCCQCKTTAKWSTQFNEIINIASVGFIKAPKQRIYFSYLAYMSNERLLGIKRLQIYLVLYMVNVDSFALFASCNRNYCNFFPIFSFPLVFFFFIKRRSYKVKQSTEHITSSIPFLGIYSFYHLM